MKNVNTNNNSILETSPNSKTLLALPEDFLEFVNKELAAKKVPEPTKATIVAQLHIIWNTLFLKLRSAYVNNQPNSFIGMSIRQPLDVLISQHTNSMTRKFVTDLLFISPVNLNNGLFTKDRHWFGLGHLYYSTVSMSPRYASLLNTEEFETTLSSKTYTVSEKHWKRYVERKSTRALSAKKRRTKDREKRNPGLVQILNRNLTIKAALNNLHTSSDYLSDASINKLILTLNTAKCEKDKASVEKFLFAVKEAKNENKSKNIVSQSYKYFTRFYCPLFSLKSTYRNKLLEENNLKIVDLPSCRASSAIAALVEPRTLRFLEKHNITLESVASSFFLDKEIPNSDKAALMSVTGKLLRTAIAQTPTGSECFSSEKEIKSLLNSLFVTDTQKLAASKDKKDKAFASRLSVMRRAIKELQGGNWLVDSINALLEQERNSVHLFGGKNTHLPTLFFERIESTVVHVFCERQLKAGNFCVPFHDAIIVKKENAAKVEKEFVHYLINEVHMYPSETHFYGIPAFATIEQTQKEVEPSVAETKETTKPSKYNNDFDAVTDKLNKELCKSGNKQVLSSDIPGRIAYDKRVGPYASPRNTPTTLPDASVTSENDAGLSRIKEETEKLVEASMASNNNNNSRPPPSSYGNDYSKTISEILATDPFWN